MRRRTPRPFGQSISATRAMSLLMSLALLAMLYSWMRQPASWKWLVEVEDSGPVASVQAVEALPSGQPPAALPVIPAELVVPGPNDLDAEDLKDYRSKLPLVSDRVELRPREMHSYWQLMKWSLTEPIKKTESRANAGTSFSQLWEEPKKYRETASPIRLRMHVRRVLKYEAAKNPLDMKHCYEIWGWTEDSKSFPYCVVVPELPSGMKVGPDIRGEIVFVGYFFKIMTYMTSDKKTHGAPLLIGRVRSVATAPPPEPINIPSTLLVVGAVVGVIIFSSIAIRHLLSFRRRPSTMLPDSMHEGFGMTPFPLGTELPVTAGRGESDGFPGQLGAPEDSGWAPGRS